MPVNVVDWNKEDDRMFEQSGARLCDHDVAQESQPCVFAIGLARVNVRLNKHDDLARPVRCFRRERAALRGDDERERAPFTAPPKLHVTKQGRSGGEPTAVSDRLVIARRLAVISLLRRCPPFGRGVLCVGLDGHDRKQ